MTEPVTANSQRFARCLWSLDRNLAYSRHYPALSWTASFSLDSDAVAAWHAATGRPAWASQRARLQQLLGEADRLSSVAELVGAAALAGPERVVLLSARLIRDALLAQSALSANDAYCALPKQSALAGALIELHERATTLVAGGTPVALVEQVDFTPLVRAGEELAPDDAAGVEARAAALFAVLERLG